MRAWGLRYGLLGLPLAFVALPLYVSLPAYYAGTFEVPLAQLGALLLLARLIDAGLDPLIGTWADGWLSKRRQLPWVMGSAAVVMVLAFAGLFFPPEGWRGTALLPWAALMLVLGYTAFSVLTVSHQTWGSRIGGNALQQTRVVAWREGCALVGVLAASVLISEAGWGVTTAVLACTLTLGLVLLLRLETPLAGARESARWSLAWRTPPFRKLLLVYAVNGIAAAIPATVLLFYVRDRLQAPQQEALFLVAYFLAAALSLPLWLRAVARFGQAQAWLMGMGLAVISFVWAGFLGAGDVTPFLLVCIASGVAVGADLAIPAAMLTRVVQNAGLAGRAEGAFFGWWNGVSKLNLALAAGVALPLLQGLGYREGAQDEASLQALAAVYALLPCLLKLGAMALLWQFFVARRGRTLNLETAS
jgi:glycoside/pentoside/hexuronide:cation symporter, GPH family